MKTTTVEATDAMESLLELPQTVVQEAILHLRAVPNMAAMKVFSLACDVDTKGEVASMRVGTTEVLQHRHIFATPEMPRRRRRRPFRDKAESLVVVCLTIVKHFIPLYGPIPAEGGAGCDNDESEEPNSGACGLGLPSLFHSDGQIELKLVGAFQKKIIKNNIPGRKIYGVCKIQQWEARMGRINKATARQPMKAEVKNEKNNTTMTQSKKGFTVSAYVSVTDSVKRAFFVHEDAGNGIVQKNGRVKSDDGVVDVVLMEGMEFLEAISPGAADKRPVSDNELLQFELSGRGEQTDSS
jgi:hypothetical protein